MDAVAERVLGLLSGGDIDRGLVAAWCEEADVVYAADSSARTAIELGVTPIIVGDMDSFVRLPDDPNMEIRRDASQSSTDCDKLLSNVALDGHRAVTLVGTEGDRPDHVISTYGSAARSGLRVRIGFRNGMGWILSGGEEVAIEMGRGHRLSLLALENCTGVDLVGCAWPLEQADLSATTMHSVSNFSVADRVVARVGKGAALLYVEFRREEMPFW